ncbi:MAG: linear amide C-N hydrolase [Clostridiales bacterium]|nr:linear amide C-N hydrolase [Clostridiales bacterium]
MKRKKILRIVFSCLIIVLLSAGAGVWAMFGEKVHAATTVEKVTDGLYMMEYEGDYGFDTFLEQGGASSNEEMAGYIMSFLSGGLYKHNTVELAEPDYGCSTLFVEGNGEYLFGRNYDWEDCSAMIVHTKPENGYESYSTCCLDFLGFGENWKPEDFSDRYMALAAVYVPLDGMNEMGLCVADLMAGDSEETDQMTNQPDLTTTTAIRLILDHAATVDEAVALLEQYDMHSVIGTAHHFAIADASGKSVVVEYVSGEMVVTQTDIVTNHYLSEKKYGIGSEQSHKRFDTLTVLKQDYEEMKTEGKLAEGAEDCFELKKCMQTVAQSNYPGEEQTQWTVLYHTGALCLEFYRREQYETGYRFELRSKGKMMVITGSEEEASDVQEAERQKIEIWVDENVVYSTSDLKEVGDILKGVDMPQWKQIAELPVDSIAVCTLRKYQSLQQMKNEMVETGRWKLFQSEENYYLTVQTDAEKRDEVYMVSKNTGKFLLRYCKP